MRKRKRKTEFVIEPLPWIDVPQEHVEALDLDCDTKGFDAVYLSSNDAAVVSDGKTSYIVAAVQSRGLAEWLDGLNLRPEKEGYWLVICLPSRQGYVLGAEPAEAMLQVQWTDTSNSMTMEELFRKDKEGLQ